MPINLSEHTLDAQVCGCEAVLLVVGHEPATPGSTESMLRVQTVLCLLSLHLPAAPSRVSVTARQVVCSCVLATCTIAHCTCRAAAFNAPGRRPALHSHKPSVSPDGTRAAGWRSQSQGQVKWAANIIMLKNHITYLLNKRNKGIMMATLSSLNVTQCHTHKGKTETEGIC